MLIQLQVKNVQDQVHIFHYIYFKSFQVHQKVIKYHFKHTNYVIHLNFLI